MAKSPKKRGNPRGPYRCALCRELGHRKDVCPHKNRAQQILNDLPGAIALASLVPEMFQVLAVVEGQTQAALIGAIEGNQKLAERGIPHNNSMINAYTELARRASSVPQPVIMMAREARQALLRAEEAYADATQPIRAALAGAAHASKAKP